MESGPRWLDVGPWSLIRPTTSVVCSLADQRGAWPILQHRHGIPRYLHVGPARYVEVLADRVRPVGVAPSRRETHRHPEGIRISAPATSVVLRLGSAIVSVVEETESHLTTLFYHRRLHDVAARVEAEQLIVFQILHVPVVVPVARVEEGGGGGTVAVVADGVVDALGGGHLRGDGVGAPPGNFEMSGPDVHDRRAEPQLLLSAGILDLYVGELRHPQVGEEVCAGIVYVLAGASDPVGGIGLNRVVACTAVKPVPLGGVTVPVVEAIVAVAAGKYVYTVSAPQLIVAGSSLQSIVAAFPMQSIVATLAIHR